MHPNKVVALSNKKLLKLYFKIYGRMTHEGFISPIGGDGETTDCGFALQVLKGRKSGGKLLARLHQQFLKGKLDAFGKTLEFPRWKLSVNGKTINIEVVHEPEEVWRSLVRRVGLKKGEGILHKASHSRNYILHMDEREYPVDVAWAKDGKVISIEKNLPPVDETLPEAKLFTKGVEYDESAEAKLRITADRVLILKSGELERLGIAPGIAIQSP